VGKSFVRLGDGSGPSSRPNPLPSVPRGRTLLDDLIGEGDFDPSMDEEQDDPDGVEGAENRTLKNHNIAL